MTVEGKFKNEEKEAIMELRERMDGAMELDMFEDDYVFFRFLKARDFNVNNAETMLRKHLKWREKNDLKNISNFQQTEVMKKYITFSHIGYDKDGCVVRYIPSGNIDIKGILSSMSVEDFIKYPVHVMECDVDDLKKQSEKLGRNVDKCVYIHNLENLSFAKVTDKQIIYLVILILDLYINNYPERLKAVYILNVSIYFNILFSAVKSILPKTILDKIYFFSDDSYKEELLKVIDADVLPAFLGGKKTDPDGNPLCRMFVNHGGEKVPERYHLSKCKKMLSKAPDAKKVTLSRAAFHEVTVQVREPGSYLEWEFETKCRDIGFGLFYQELVDGEEKITEIIPIQRIDTEAYPETGTFKCDVTGIYVVVFDNTYSWVRAKEIYYRVKVVAPKQHESAQIIDEEEQE